MTYASLFAGIGGFDLALTRLGLECVYANDHDPYCKTVYDQHFSPALDLRDLRLVPSSAIPDFDLLCGGFPCQPFSVAGRRGGFDDTRGTLFFELARLARDKRPAYLLLENVKGLLSHHLGRTFEVILRTLDELGYDVQWQVVNSKDFGVPQDRQRVVIVGHLRTHRRPQVFPLTEGRGLCAQARPGTEETLAPTLTAKQGGPDINLQYVLAEGRMRRLTPVECERLQGFPDNWTAGVSDTQRYKMLGNAVTVNVIYEIAKRLI